MALRDKIIRSYQPAPTDDDDAHDAPVVDTTVEAASDDVSIASSETSAPAVDEFAAVLEQASDVTSADAEASSTETAPADAPAPAADPEEDRELSDEEKLLAEYRAQTGQTQEQAVAWLRQQKAAAAARQSAAPETEEEKRQQQRPGQAVAAGGSAIGSIFGGLGGAIGAAGTGLRSTVGSTIRAGRAARDAARRATGINRGAGLTPEVVRERMFDKWHGEYEAGLKKMDDSMESLVRAAAAYNQVVRMSAPGRELEKIAKSRGQNLDTLMSEITSGKADDALLKDHMEALRTDPKVQKTWSKVDAHTQALERGAGMWKDGLRKLGENFSDRLDMGIESARAAEILERHSQVEKPFEIPANPIGDQKANGKSLQKNMWEQFQEMTQNGLSFLRDLVDKFQNFANAVAAKFGGR